MSTYPAWMQLRWCNLEPAVPLQVINDDDDDDENWCNISRVGFNYQKRHLYENSDLVTIVDFNKISDFQVWPSRNFFKYTFLLISSANQLVTVDALPSFQTLQTLHLDFHFFGFSLSTFLFSSCFSRKRRQELNKIKLVKVGSTFKKPFNQDIGFTCSLQWYKTVDLVLVLFCYFFYKAYIGHLAFCQCCQTQPL